VKVAVPKETAPGERRVALVPEIVSKLTASGIDVIVEAGAGEAASFSDEAFREGGAVLGDPWSAEVVD
jgi:NAD(P) transhydrogenase subunit alpha